MRSIGRYVWGRALRLLGRDTVALVLFIAVLVYWPTGLASLAGDLTRFATENLEVLVGSPGSATNAVKPPDLPQPSSTESKGTKRGAK